MSGRLQHDAWLSRFAGKSAFHLTAVDRPADIPAAEIAAHRAPIFIDTRVDVARSDICCALEDLGFHLIEANVQLTATAGSIGRHIPDGFLVRDAVADDEIQVSQLSGRSSVWDRFHRDPLFPDDAADQLKAEWAGNFFRGRRGDAMIVAAHAGQIVGFLQLLAPADGRLIIDLLAVDAGFRQRGAARAMIGYAAAARDPRSVIQVGTQIANQTSLRLYQGMGFRLVSSTYGFHFHGNG
jgi:ribosomal protein S18 acetylase RimI-like enzyme